MNKWKPLSKFLGIWTFLLLFLLKETVPQPAAAQSSLACARSKECLMLLAESTVKAIRVVNTAIKITTLVTNITANGNATVNDWTETQTLMAQDRAWQRYCATNPKDIVCAGRMPGVRYRIIADICYESPITIISDGRWTTVFQPYTIHQDTINNSGSYQPYGLINAVYINSKLLPEAGNSWGSGSWNPQPAEYYGWQYFISWGNPPRQQGGISQGGLWVRPGQPPKIKNLQVFPADGRPDTGGALPWKDWDQEKRDAAVKLLTDSDWQEIANTMPFVGVRSPGDMIEAPDGDIIVNHEPATNAPNGSQPWAEKVPNSYTFPSTSNPSNGDAANPTDGNSEQDEDSPEERNPAQDQRLSKGEIDALKRGGEDPEALKEYNAGLDLFKDKKGNIYIKPKNGQGPGEPTGLNINDFL